MAQTVPIEQTLEGLGFKLDTQYPFGTAYGTQIGRCFWKGYYTNGHLNLTALVSLGAVQAVGQPGRWIISPYGTSVANQIWYTRQALHMADVWAGLNSGGPAAAVGRSANVVVSGTNGQVGVTAVTNVTS